jgi:hypothetical protein
LSDTVREPGVNSEGNRRERDQVETPQGAQVTVPDPGERESSPQAQTFYVKLRRHEGGAFSFRIEREVRKLPKRAGRRFCVSGGTRDLDFIFTYMRQLMEPERCTPVVQHDQEHQ